MKYYNTPKKNRSLSVYIILSLCLVAIGIGAKTLMTAMSEPSADTQSTKNDTTSVTGDVNNIISDITYSDISSTESKTEKPTSKPDTPANKPVASELKQIAASYFVLPVTGNIIKGFSENELQYSATFNDMRLHLGIDIAADASTAIKAAGDGVVKEVKTSDTLGVTVVIDHGNGITASYSGLEKNPTVKAGDQVHSGTTIGSLGTVPCESLDRSHLHLEFTKDSKPVSPLQIMGMEE